MQKIFLNIVLCWLWLALNIADAAPRYPELKNNYVNDYAQVLTPSDENDLRQTLQSLENRTRVEVTVLTINSVRDYDKTASLESFATGLFNKWGIGNLPANDGVMLLVAIKDRRLRIELGSGYDESYNAVSKDILDEDMTPLLKKGKPRDAIFAGTQAIISRIAEDHGTAGQSTASAAIEGGQSMAAVTNSSQRLFAQVSSVVNQGLSKTNEALQRISPHLSVGKVGGGVGGVAVLIWLIQRVLRNRPRRCNTCGNTMQRLNESDDDAFLDAGQLMEERLSSVDYDVWQCGGCGNKQVYAYKKWFSSYDTCPGCNKRTLQSTSTVTVQATYTSTGTKIVKEDCKHCTYHSSRTVIIPVRQRSSSSSSSGSGGGGRSSGGGASGSW